MALEAFLSVKQRQYLLTWGNPQRSGEPVLWPGSACQAYRQEENKEKCHQGNIQIKPGSFS